MMKQFLDDLRLTIESSTKQLLLISEAQSGTPRAAGKWAPKEIVGHLIDSAANNHIRFVQAQLGEHLDFPGYEQEKWVSLQRYKQEPWEQLVQLWRHYNLHLVHLIAGISDDVLKQSRSKHNLHRIAWQTVPEDEPVTLEYFIRDYVMHMKNHLRQILG
jgi:hypothetical protein